MGGETSYRCLVREEITCITSPRMTGAGGETSYRWPLDEQITCNANPKLQVTERQCGSAEPETKFDAECGSTETDKASVTEYGSKDGQADSIEKRITNLQCGSAEPGLTSETECVNVDYSENGENCGSDCGRAECISDELGATCGTECGKVDRKECGRMNCKENSVTDCADPVVTNVVECGNLQAEGYSGTECGSKNLKNNMLEVDNPECGSAERESRKEKARKLSEKWALLRECTIFLRENNKKWEKRTREETQKIRKEEKEMRLRIVEERKKKFGINKLKKHENEDLKAAMEKKLELAEYKKNLWRNYRDEGKEVTPSVGKKGKKEAKK